MSALARFADSSRTFPDVRQVPFADIELSATLCVQTGHKTGRYVSMRVQGARPGGAQLVIYLYFPACDWMAFSICSLTASRLKLAPFCMGGNSIAVWATLATSCCTNWKRQNWQTNQL